MPQLKSISRYQPSESFVHPLFMSCFGLIFIGIGLYFLMPPWGPWGEVVGYFSYAPLVFVAFGIILIMGGISPLKRVMTFGKPEALVSESQVQLGSSIHFVYQQECLQSTKVHFIRMFLVFRERVDYDDVSETTTKDVDRLVQQFAIGERLYSAGETIREECVFQIPSRNMGIRNAFMGRRKAEVRTMWVVKVRINLGKYQDIWNEYQLEVNGDAMEDATLEAQHHFDVYLIKHSPLAPVRHSQVLDSLFPHLDSGQIGDLFVAKPYLLLERVTESTTHRAQTQLNAANIDVEIRPSL